MKFQAGDRVRCKQFDLRGIIVNPRASRVLVKFDALDLTQEMWPVHLEHLAAVDQLAEVSSDG